MKIGEFLRKKIVKIPLIIIGSFVVLILLINLIAPPIIKNWAEAHSKELCGRTVTLEKLRLNLFTGNVKIFKLNALEADDKTSFVAFEQLDVNINLWRLLAREVRLTHIRLEEPRISVWQNGSLFNFNDIIDHFSSGDDEPEPDDSKPWAIDLRKISIERGEIIYQDLIRKSHFDLQDLSLAVPRLYFSNESSDIGIEFKFANGGNIRLKLLYEVDKKNYNLDVALNNFSVDAVKPYLVDFLNIGNISGNLSAKMAISGCLDHIFEIVANGTVDLDQFSSTLKDGKELLSMQNLHLNVKKIDVKQKLYQLDTLAFNNFTFNFENLPESTTMTQLFKEEEANDTVAESAPASTTKSSPINLKINHLAVNESAVNYRDLTMEEPFAMPISHIKLSANNVTLTSPFQFNMDATVGARGSLSCKWDGNLNNLTTQKFILKLQNFTLADISPFTIHYFAYPISDGLLTFTSKTNIVNSAIQSQNDIDIFKCKVEKKVRKMKPEYKIPLKSAIYILADRKGKIKLKLPVEGNLQEPDFSVRKIVFKAIGNLFVKILASPIDAIINSLGVDANTFADMQVNTFDKEINSEHYARLNAMSDVLKEKEEITLEVQQSYNYKDQFQAYSNLLQTTDTLIVRQEIEKDIEVRNNLLKAYFFAQNIGFDRINFLPIEKKKVPKGKVVFSFNIVLPEPPAEESADLDLESFEE